tara:strand:+ start:870 stop:1796 length:927 start_codon:yes stop_codon:yes gene_type:complete
MKPFFIITIDTEADDAWFSPDKISLTNFKEIPRFQMLCENYNIIPTYLLTYEYATFEPAVKYFKEKQNQGKCEIGMHLHVWSTPPFKNNEDKIDLDWVHAFQSELPDDLFEQKANYLYNAICDSFESAPTSHRAGRWGIDDRTIKWLVRKKFKVDSSVVPMINYKSNKGKNVGGPDFTNFNHNPYEWNKLLEIPVSVYRNIFSSLTDNYSNNRFFKWISNKVSPLYILRPIPSSSFKVYDKILNAKSNIYNMMLHSSELGLDCSPFTKTKNDYNKIWKIIEHVFQIVEKKELTPITLSQYADLRQNKR